MLFATIFFLLMTNNFAQNLDSSPQTKSENRTVRINYLTQENDGLFKIYSRFIKKGSVLNKNTPMLKRTLKSNPHIKNWRKIPDGESIKLYVQKELLDEDKVKKFLKEKNLKKGRAKSSSYSLFYMASIGDFNQEDSIGTINFRQNSPLTLGLSYYRPFKNSQYSLSSSLYFSYLTSTTNNLNNQDEEIAPEIGATLYLERKKDTWSLTPYIGLDLERFSSINTNEANLNNQLYFDQHLFTYLTVGLTGTFNIFKKSFFNKFSFSHSLLTSLQSENADTQTEDNFSGFKFMYYLNTNITKRFFAHSLVKYHVISGPSSIRSYRIGLGFGYKF